MFKSSIYRLRCAVALAGVCTAQAQQPQVIVRVAPIYQASGKLENMAFVVNFRTPSGVPARHISADWAISGPWGERSWRGVASDGYAWLAGKGQYLPGHYKLVGQVSGQKVNIAIKVPTEPVPEIGTSFMISRNKGSASTTAPKVGNRDTQAMTDYLYPKPMSAGAFANAPSTPEPASNILIKSVRAADPDNIWIYQRIAWNAASLYAARGHEEEPLIGRILFMRACLNNANCW